MITVQAHKDSKYSLFNGLECRIVSMTRDDGLYEVYIPTMDIYILLYKDEVDSDL